MGENLDNLQQNQQTHQSSSRLSSRSLGGGQIVQVQGGHIIRSTGLKDRHSKVCTAKGPRDRRVRLSATTAIQFYDVQDRLGYDRPSKAVDWLIKNSKAAIDELGELPPWDPTSYLSGNSFFPHEQPPKHREICGLDVEPASKRPMKRMVGGGIEGIHNGSSSSFSFLPPPLNSNSIADTIKSFFPVGGSTAEEHSSNMQFQSFPPSDFLSRTSGQSQDLRLSLQSFQDPIFLHQHNQQAQHQASTCNSEQVQAQIQAHANALFSRANHLGFDASGWSEHHQPAEIGRLQRLAAWNQCGDAANSGGGFLFTSQPMQQQQQQPLLQQLIGQNQLLSQRGPLQSSNTPSVRAWIDRSSLAISEADNIQHHQSNQAVFSINPSSISGIGLASGGGRFSGFRNPARIPGEEEEHGGFSDKPSSASSGSHH